MLTENNITIPVSTLKALFAIIEPEKPAELCLEEFIRFSFDKKANKSKWIVTLKHDNRVQTAYLKN